MKRAKVILLVAAAAAIAALAASLLLPAPRRPRPEGWRQPWAGLPLLQEGEWAVDRVKRGVVQGEFFSATDELAHCVQQDPSAEGEVLELELLVETERGYTHFEFVDSPPRDDLPDGLVSCVTGTLEAAAPLPTPGIPEGTRWRLAVKFLVPPLKELPRVPWWKRWLPERWRSRGDAEPHIG